MAESNPASERRRSPRIHVSFPVTLTWGQKQYRSQAMEFSEFGILLASTRKELVGNDVELDLKLDPKRSALSLSGVVAYATDTGLAVRFKNISAESEAILRNFIKNNGSKT